MTAPGLGLDQRRRVVGVSPRVLGERGLTLSSLKPFHPQSTENDKGVRLGETSLRRTRLLWEDLTPW